MDYKYENGKFEPYELPDWGEQEDFAPYLERIGFGKGFAWTESAIAVYVYESRSGHDFIVEVDIGCSCRNVYVPTFPDLLELLNVLAPLRDLSRREMVWDEEREEKYERWRKEQR